MEFKYIAALLLVVALVVMVTGSEALRDVVDSSCKDKVDTCDACCEAKGHSSGFTYGGDICICAAYV